MMTVVLDSDLISDVLSLPVRDMPSNKGVVRNMLMLLQVMLLNKNEKAIEQMKRLIPLLLNILTDSLDLGHLALSLIGLLANFKDIQG
jgi:hypothetical protein